jgi:hypothetical protein
MADFDHVIPEIRQGFDAVEGEFLEAAPSVLKGTPKEKREFMNYCFAKAEKATEAWTERLCSQHNLAFTEPAYRAMWDKFNRHAGLTGLPG